MITHLAFSSHCTFIFSTTLPSSLSVIHTGGSPPSCPQRVSMHPTRPRPSGARHGPSAQSSTPQAQFRAGEEIEGTVVRIVDFGAFVDVGNGVSGLVHISEITDGFVRNVADHLAVGDKVHVRVSSYTPRTKKLSLSIKQSTHNGATGYDRIVELGGDWGHPWGDDGEAKFADLGPRPARRPHEWEPDLSLFEPFDSKKPPS